MSICVQLPALQRTVPLHLQGIIWPLILKVRPEKSFKISFIHQSTKRPIWENLSSCWLLTLTVRN